MAWIERECKYVCVCVAVLSVKSKYLCTFNTSIHLSKWSQYNSRTRRNCKMSHDIEKNADRQRHRMRYTETEKKHTPKTERRRKFAINKLPQGNAWKIVWTESFYFLFVCYFAYCVLLCSIFTIPQYTHKHTYTHEQRIDGENEAFSHRYWEQTRKGWNMRQRVELLLYTIFVHSCHNTLNSHECLTLPNTILL